MYRRAGSVSVLSGVLSGPYAGGTKTIDAALLEAATRRRLERALAGRDLPEPIAYERLGSRGKINPSWGVIIATMGLLVLVALGFGDFKSRFAEVPRSFLAIYLALGALFGFCLVPVIRRFALAGEGALRPGRYLFPLDAIDVALPDARGHQRVTVRPLGDARDATVEEKGRAGELVIRFEGGETLRWALRGDPQGDIALRQLERAQRMLEELSYAKELEQAFANDVFFDVRVDGSWAKLAPGATSASTRAPTTLMMITLGRFAPVMSVLIALGFGGGTYLLRSFAGDAALFNRAVASENPEVLGQYIAIGGHRRAEADERRSTLLEIARLKREAEQQQRDADAAREQAWRSWGRDDVKKKAATDAGCIASLEAIASKRHPKPVRLLALRLDAATTPSDRIVFVDFDRRGHTEESLSDLADYERAIVDAFQRVLADACPSSILRFATTSAPKGYAARLAVSYAATQAGPVWTLAGPHDTVVDVHGERFQFDVKLLDRAGQLVDGFTLDLAPPAEALFAPRNGSLFANRLDPHVVAREELAMQAQTARAFDRLYDEVWSLFFGGDPHVPLGGARAVLTE